MAAKINLVLADSVESATQVVNLKNIDNDNTAVITHPDYMEHLTFKNGERVFVSSSISDEFMGVVLNKIREEFQIGQELNLTIVNTI